MKIGDKIIIDEDFYIKKYREVFGNDIEIDGLTNDNKIDGCLIRAIKNKKYLEITDISTNLYHTETKSGVQIFIHFKDEENYEGLIDSKYVKYCSDDLGLTDVLLNIVERLNIEYTEKINILKSLEERVHNDIRLGKKIMDEDLKSIHCLSVLLNSFKIVLKK